MSKSKSSTKTQGKSTRTPRIATAPHNQLQPGQLVTIYDAISTANEQYQLADVVERDGRQRIRLVGFNYYMDSNLIKEVHINA